MDADLTVLECEKVIELRRIADALEKIAERPVELSDGSVWLPTGFEYPDPKN